MSRAPLLPVQDALMRVLASAPVPLTSERVPLAECRGRTLAEEVAALRTQPPFPASAMDGYAVRAADIAQVPATLNVIGESAAGRRFSGEVKAGEAVRIFTGAPVPAGADTILIQENTKTEGTSVTALETETLGRYVRRAGLDFSAGDVLLKKGQRLGPAELALAAAMNHPALAVTRRPRVALLATGDELVRPGEEIGPTRSSPPIHSRCALMQKMLAPM